MVPGKLREWSDKKAFELKRDPDKFFKLIEKIDFKKTSVEKLAEILELEGKDRKDILRKADYLRRGYDRYGMNLGQADLGVSAVTKMNFRVMERMKVEYQKVLDEEAALEAKMQKVQKRKDKFKPFIMALQNAEKQAQTLKTDGPETVS